MEILWWIKPKSKSAIWAQSIKKAMLYLRLMGYKQGRRNQGCHWHPQFLALIKRKAFSKDNICFHTFYYYYPPPPNLFDLPLYLQQCLSVINNSIFMNQSITPHSWTTSSQKPPPSLQITSNFLVLYGISHGITLGKNGVAQNLIYSKIWWSISWNCCVS